MWAFKLAFLAKLLLHFEQENGFSPVWVRMWSSRQPLLWQYKPQYWQENFIFLAGFIGPVINEKNNVYIGQIFQNLNTSVVAKLVRNMNLNSNLEPIQTYLRVNIK